MNKAAITSSRWILLAAIAIPVMASGCRSGGWKPSSMFAWNRQAEADAIGGPATVEMPTGPAGKYTPNAIASIGAKPPAAADGSEAAASAYGYTAETVATPQAGLAAKANGFQTPVDAGSASSSGVGYQTGPYQLAATRPQATAGGTAGGTSGSMAATGTAGGTGSLPNPYGGTYKGPSQVSAPENTTAPDIQLPTSVLNSLGQAKAATAGTMPQPSSSGAVGGMPVPAQAVSTGAIGSVQSPLPGGAAFPSYPPSVQTATAGSSSLPATYPEPSAYPSSGYGVGSGAAGGGSAAATTGTSSGASGFTPGTTGRSTKYDFSNSGN